MHKVSVISSIVLIILISVIFSFLYRFLERSVLTERGKTNRFLNLSVALAVNSIQDEISYTYRELSDLCEIAKEKNIVDREQYLKDKLMKNPNGIYSELMLEESEIISYETDLLDSLKILTSLESGISISLKNYLEEQNSKVFKEKVFINNFNGIMIFPLWKNKDDELIKLLVYRLELKDLIKKALPELVEEFMASTSEANKRELSGFTSKVFTGYDLKNEKNVETNDLIIDLNRVFNMNTIVDYHISRLERNYIHFADISNIIDNHLYLSIGHESGSIDEYYRIRLSNYILGLVTLYIFTIGSVIILLYSTYKVRLSVMREKEFTTMVSHELKTPHSAITLGANNLSGGFVKDRAAVSEYGELIGKEAQRLGDMIGKILSISGTLDSSSLSRSAKVKVKDIGSDLKKQCQSLLESSGVELIINYNNCNEYLFCNKVTLTGALFNILQNCIIYGAANAEIKKVILNFNDESRKKKEGLFIQISDYGPGITWKESRKIFKPFYRGTIGKTLHISGTGLGLSISRKIIKQHKGQIQLSRSSRKETKFQVWIPNRKKMKKILMIEDDASLVRFIGDRLKAEGYEVDHARDGILGLNKAIASEYDILLV